MTRRDPGGPFDWHELLSVQLWLAALALIGAVGAFWWMVAAFIPELPA